MSIKNNENSLGTKNISSLLVTLSMPATIGMIVNSLYNIIDTIFIGQGVGPLAIGALTVAFPIQIIVMGISQLVGIGAASNISRSLGANKKSKANKYAGNSFFMIIVISTIITFLGLSFLDNILITFGATEGLIQYSRDYMSVIFMGTIFFSFAVSSNNIIRSEGQAKVAMVSMLVGTILNIVLDPIFIFVFKMGIKGAAYATIISQFMSFLYVMTYLFSGKSSIKFKVKNLKPDLNYIKDIFIVGLPSFMRQVASSFTAILLNNIVVNLGGDYALAAFGVINRIIMFTMMPMFGVIQGMQPIVGFNYGAKKFDRVKKTISISIKFLLIYATTMSVIVFIFATNFLEIFSTDQQVVSIGKVGLKTIMLGIPIIGIQVVSATVYQSLGLAKPALFLSLLRQVILFIPLLLILPNIFGLGIYGVWMTYPISDIVSTLISAVLLKSEIKKLN